MERKCEVPKKGKKGICHGFFQVDAGPGDSGPVAVVEINDGTVDTFAAIDVILCGPTEKTYTISEIKEAFYNCKRDYWPAFEEELERQRGLGLRTTSGVTVQVPTEPSSQTLPSRPKDNLEGD